MYPSESRSLSTYAFISGKSVIANEHAFTKNGSKVSFGYTYFNSLRNRISWFALIASEYVRKGIDFDSVIVLVIAFLMPVIS